MDDEAMRWTMRRCCGAMRWGYVTIAPSHRRIVHRIASSSIASPHRPSHRPIASPHRPSHRLIVHRIASSSIALDIIINASVSLLGHHNCETWPMTAIYEKGMRTTKTLMKIVRSFDWCKATELLYEQDDI